MPTIDNTVESSSKSWRFRSEYLANFGVQYNFNTMSIALLFLSNGDVWYNEDKWGGNVSSVLKSIIFAGSIFGMCIMGYVGDVMGRNHAFALTSMIMVTFSLASAFGPWGENGDVAMIVLAVARFGLGFGIGGCYPLSAAKSAEGGGESVADKNFDVGLNLFFQAIGNIAPYVVALILNPIHSATWKFRICLALGAIPPFIVMLSTWGEEESEEFKHANNRQYDTLFATTLSTLHSGTDGHSDEETEAIDEGKGKDKQVSSYQLAVEHLKAGLRKENIVKNVLATALGWLIYDVGYYGSNAFTPTITDIVFGDHDDEKVDMTQIVNQGMIATSVGIPGVMTSLWLLSRIGTKRLSVYGFLLIAAASGLLAILWTPIDDSWTLFGLFIFLTFSVNWGPNLTTFVLPQEVFDIEIRGTFNGFAAACGKLGALMGIWIFEKVSDEYGIVPLMIIVCLLNLIGALLTQVCISDNLWEFQQASSVAQQEREERRKQPLETAQSPGLKANTSSNSAPSGTGF